MYCHLLRRTCRSLRASADETLVAHKAMQREEQDLRQRAAAAQAGGGAAAAAADKRCGVGPSARLFFFLE
eukprot:327763-Chlamydomonas_euryale.AAC.3